MMVFHESYGDLPESVLAMVRKYNVSPADYDMIYDKNLEDWESIRNTIKLHSTGGYLQLPWDFFS